MPIKQKLSPRPAATNVLTNESAQLATINFIKEITSINFLKPDGQPDPKWRIFTGSTWEKANDRAMRSLEASGREISNDAEQKIPHSERPNPMERSASDTALTATWHTAKVNCWGPANDASLMVRAFFADDESGSKGYVKLAQARWEVWKKGYWLVGESNGELYVCEKRRELFRDALEFILPAALRA